MVEYLAHPCAVGGGLLAALEAGEPDDALLDGAGDLVCALINGGPAQDMTDYDDGARVVPLFLAHVAARASHPVRTFLAVADVADFVDDTARAWDGLADKGWTAENRERVSHQATDIMARPHWRGAVEAGLASTQPFEFQQAARAATRLGIDVWERYFERQRAGADSWWWDVMRTRDPARIDRIVDLALAQLDLAAIATGPADDLGLGPAYRQQSDLGLILQVLGAFPGRGWVLVEAGLRCRTVRNRNMALKTLHEWGRPAWPESAEAALRAAHEAEPRDDVRTRIAELLED